MTYRKKLIEVALPLEAINKSSAMEKSIRQGHPSTLHLWWARRPLAAARAVIFSQMVDDPSEYVDELLRDPIKRKIAETNFNAQLKSWENKKGIFDKARLAGMSNSSNPNPGLYPTLQNSAIEIERLRLFNLIEKFVVWENSNNESLLKLARNEIWKTWRRTCNEPNNNRGNKEIYNPTQLPSFHDPFAGGGTLPLEAQRFGLDCFSSDLNPIAVLINKAMIEIPPQFRNFPPINPEGNQQGTFINKNWSSTQGLAEDVRYYGKWMRNEVEACIKDLYPQVEITSSMVKDRPDLETLLGHKLTVIAWLWTRTVKSPNPAFNDIDVPLISSYILSKKKDQEAYVVPIIENNNYRFNIRIGLPKTSTQIASGTKVGRGGNFTCLMSGTPIPVTYIRDQGIKGKLGSRMLAIVVQGPHGRIYLEPNELSESIAKKAIPSWVPDQDINFNPRDIRTQLYGLTKYGDLFTNRQLVALTKFSDLLVEVFSKVEKDASKRGMVSSGPGSSKAYAEAITVYLACALEKTTDYNSALCSWISGGETMRNTFGRQALPMVWDFAEANILSDTTGSFNSCLDQVIRVINELPASSQGFAFQKDAQTQEISWNKVVSTDPPYYDNIGYADLSDFFYIWLHRSLKPIFPELFSTLATPKTEELVATPYRHNNRQEADSFFINGMTRAMKCLVEQALNAYPVTIYYAFKQSETDDEIGTISTGWDSFLEAVIKAGFAITGTWPIRTEMGNRMVSSGTNALASSIVLVCRKRDKLMPTASLREFITILKSELPIALDQLQRGNIAPVDLAQASIGPGMAIYTRFEKVVDAKGKSLPVRQALSLINQTLDEVLAEQEGDFDADTRFALAWFEQYGFTEGEFGVADVLARAKDTSVNGMVDAGIIASGRGKVRLLTSGELPEDWNPQKDQRLTTWEMVHQLIRTIEKDGENEAANLLGKLGVKAEAARELCYRLYTISERKKRTTEALSYNGLVQSWPEITRLAREHYQPDEIQTTLF